MEQRSRGNPVFCGIEKVPPDPFPKTSCYQQLTARHGDFADAQLRHPVKRESRDFGVRGNREARPAVAPPIEFRTANRRLRLQSGRFIVEPA